MLTQFILHLYAVTTPNQKSQDSPEKEQKIFVLNESVLL